MFNLSIKKKLVVFSVVILLIIIAASQLMLQTLSNIDKNFEAYKAQAVDGKISTLEISKDLNYISRCTRDIMLGNDYDANIQKITEHIAIIENKFNLLYASMKQANPEKLHILQEANKTTMAFVHDAYAKVSTLKNASEEQRHHAYLEYNHSATPLANLSRGYFEELKTQKEHEFIELTEKFENEINKQKIVVGVSATIFAIMVVALMLTGFKNIIRQIQTECDLERANSLLLQYKYAIDLTNIVSKTDTDGIITYVNDEFCKISQFSKRELIGSPHSISRHSNTKNEVFQDLWQTIKAKKVWHAIVENRKKDGSNYFADTTIVPILNDKNEIEEYIAIRKDVTQIVNLNRKLTESQNEILNRIGIIAETRSKETSNHVKRVAEYSKLLASGLNFDEQAIELIASASALHDVGKVATPDHILLKPGKLTPEEFEEMKKHSEHGYNALKDSQNEIIKTGATIAYEHHEKYDGSGYPQGLAGDQIHIFARIVALADVFDALGSKRSYKDAWSLPQIINFMNEQSGKHFDPALVEILNSKIEEFIFIRKKLRSGL
ncbi:MAG: hypothetical protein RL154_645 [Pseudomonadota bacterium]